jgi:hypothetical protein
LIVPRFCWLDLAERSGSGRNVYDKKTTNNWHDPCRP